MQVAVTAAKVRRILGTAKGRDEFFCGRRVLA
jgi:hypothetical protein